ncbi:hypothetical protein INT48_007235 [Thamnidium elegans]|uniref:m7GpppX diphosphatase n=1 Tax=Thamnidium elegans TaxID=101142 RepID=A0A8H7VZF7_9FUNG|nr:hypothetical protein INT48_007235 [Thamnidium elegans]
MSSIQDILSKFEFTRVLSHDTRTKLVFLLGQVEGQDCIVSFEKTQFDDSVIPQLTRSVGTMDDVVENNIYGWCMAQMRYNVLDTRVKTIYPATDVHIAKYEAQSRVMLVETPSLYQSITLPYIKSIPAKRTQWVQNILNGSAESDRVIYHDHHPETGFVILPDMKWDGHSETLYWVAISMQSDILSLRSLNSSHLTFLKKLRDTSYRFVKEKANLDSNQLRLFIHYQPSYYHFHVHITAVSFADAPGVVSGQAHLLDTVINNIELFPDYYQKVDLPFVIGEKHELVKNWKPYRSFSRCCPHCETEVTPCDFSNSYCASLSKTIALLINQFFKKYTLQHSTSSILPDKTYQQYLINIFDKSDWRNSTLPDIHQQLMTTLIKLCQLIDQIDLAEKISKAILQLEMRPDTWRKLQFDHISFFSNTNCPSCDKLFCLQCGHEDAHINLTCEENMKQLIMQNEQQQINNDLVQTLKWKLENSRNCPSCSIMINRDEGCNKVDCTLCGFSFCWECKLTWSDGCGYFNCPARNRVDSDEDEGITAFQLGNSSTRTELGVPNIDIIHSRLNNTL